MTNREMADAIDALRDSRTGWINFDQFKANCNELSAKLRRENEEPFTSCQGCFDQGYAAAILARGPVIADLMDRIVRLSASEEARKIERDDAYEASAALELQGVKDRAEIDQLQADKHDLEREGREDRLRGAAREAGQKGEIARLKQDNRDLARSADEWRIAAVGWRNRAETSPKDAGKPLESPAAEITLSAFLASIRPGSTVTFGP